MAARRREGHTQILVYMPDEILEQINAICMYKNISRTALVNQICFDYAGAEMKRIDDAKNFSKMLRTIELKTGSARSFQPKINISNKPRKQPEVKKPEEKELPRIPDWRDDIGM